MPRLCSPKKRNTKLYERHAEYAKLVRKAALDDELPSAKPIKKILTNAGRTAAEFDRDVETLRELILYRRALPALQVYELTKRFAPMATSMLLTRWAISGLEAAFTRYLRTDRIE
jgi:hypothetical protein